ncbi:polysaccharide biosynthesis tyrosine autokinase [Granulicella sp. 5B5]|uniref:GumC family protein n=1 Tax=Granulicella sp. 5B5 TaxID=1617967 RepID=UPI0015F6CACD|nr:polysaccharide biosynthesis tyrosine autokinase [Granulicella sp. 5B5]
MFQLSASSALQGSSSLDDKLNTEVLVLTSDSLLLHVAKDLDLANKPEFFEPARTRHQVLDAPETRDAIIAQMKKSLDIAHVPKSEIISISATTHSGSLSANLVNTLINDYISNSLEVRFGSTRRVSQWLIGQLNELKGQVQSDQEKLVDLESKLGLLALDPRNPAYLNAGALATLSRASSDATLQRIVAEARYRYLNESDPNLIESEQAVLGGEQSQNSLLKNLRASQADALANYASLTAQFGKNYPAVKEAKAKVDTLSQQIKTEEDRILSQSKLAYSAATANEAMTKTALAEQQKDAFQSRDEMVRYAILQREYESHRTLYEGLVQRLEEASVDSGLQSAQIDVVDLGVPPSRARLPSPWMLFVGAVFVLLLLGAIAAVTIDLLKATFETLEEIEQGLHLPGLCLLPLETDEDQHLPFVSITKPTTHYAEGIQMVRNALLMAKPDERNNLFMVVSTVPAEGKSTIARETAATFAEHGSKVLLIDGDLRKPSQHIRMGLRREPGLTSVVSGATTFEKAVQRPAGADNLWVLTAGAAPPNAAVVWGSEKMKEVLDYCRSQFDYVILDSAPVLAVADSVVAATLADSVVLVIRHQTVDQRSIRQALTQLNRAGAHVAGVVLNAVDLRWNRYTSYYGNYTYGAYGETQSRGGE